MGEAVMNPKVVSRAAPSEAIFQSCLEYVQREPDEVEPFDYFLTREATRSLVALRTLSQEEDLDSFANNAFGAIAQVWPDSLPRTLESGLVVTTNLSDTARPTALGMLKAARDIESQLLLNLYQQAEEETRSLLVDGKTRAVVEKKTMDEVYSDAEIYYEAYVDDDNEGALKGFLYLKSLNPLDAYFRNMLGSCYSRLDRHLESIRELTYARALDLDNVQIASNLLRSLDLLALFPAALEIRRDFETRYSDKSDERDYQDGTWFGRIAEVASGALANLMFGTSEDDISTPGPELLMDSIPPLNAPWTVGRGEE